MSFLFESLTLILAAPVLSHSMCFRLQLVSNLDWTLFDAMSLKSTSRLVFDWDELWQEVEVYTGVLMLTGDILQNVELTIS